MWADWPMVGIQANKVVVLYNLITIQAFRSQQGSEKFPLVCQSHLPGAYSTVYMCDNMYVLYLCVTANIA